MSVRCKLGLDPRVAKDQERCIKSEYICDGYNHCNNGGQVGDEYSCCEY